ncbi:MAG: putative transposase [Bryobacterales bacterium]|nr:putative transposase [Bryobacterales bacterium]
MSRPPVEVADVIRTAGESFFERSQNWFTWLHFKVVNAILLCRTAGLGGHQDACSGCGYQVISFNSCRNRHCPRCQANARDRWLEAREKELLPTRYVHIRRLECRNKSILAPEILALKLGLTKAETTFASLLAAGLSVVQICGRLRIHESTARTHLRHLYQKTGARRQAELVSRSLVP